MRTRRPRLSRLDAVIRQAHNIPTNTKWRWLNEPLPRFGQWLLDNPEAAQALAEDARALTEHKAETTVA